MYCSLSFRIGAAAPRSNFLAHFSCVIVVSAAQRAASKADAAGCAVGYLLAKKAKTLAQSHQDGFFRTSSSSASPCRKSRLIASDACHS